MAMMLIDKTKDSACKSAEADVIRVKTGGSAQIAYDWANNKGFADAIAAIPSGGGVDWDGFATGAWPTGDAVMGTSVTTIKQNWFIQRTGIESIRAPGVTSIGANAFQGCTNLAEAVFAAATTVGSYALTIGSASAWAVVVLPAVTSISADAFRGSSCRFNAVDIGTEYKSISIRTFYQARFRDIILRSNTLVTLGNTSGMGVGTSGGPDESTTVYVPQALLTEYEAATNWASAKASKGFSFAAIEGSIYETQYADGTPIT